MSIANRIVLLTRRGEELFSGECALTAPPAPPTSPEEPPRREDAGEEPIPPTLRSSVLVQAREPVSRPIIVDDATPPKDGAGDFAA